MKKSYEVKSIESKNQRQIQSRNNAEHAQNDAFVKKVQAQEKKYAGKDPKLSDRLMHFNAEMSNDGKSTKKFGKKLTSGLESCYPVKG